jgi:hypothetical protein
MRMAPFGFLRRREIRIQTKRQPSRLAVEKLSRITSWQTAVPGAPHQHAAAGIRDCQIWLEAPVVIDRDDAAGGQD